MKCITCGSSFKLRKNKKQINCSRRCNAIYHNKQLAKKFVCPKCKVCGKNTARSSRAIYCSNRCAGNDRFGEKNPMWKGGITKKKDGYTSIIAHEHPFADRNNRVLTHRLIMEEFLRNKNPNSDLLVEIEGNKYLRRQVVVHHKNGKKDDNRIENLELLSSQAEHLKEHGYLLHTRKQYSPL